MTATLHYKAETALFYNFLQNTNNNYFVQLNTRIVFSIIIVRLHLAKHLI